ncbi:hypothetical protein PV10_08354 [Exophiala mesophila]|uniref:Uncharacterized protein n=1 Tax=Exophiala mesophila TaxID=212818 RepID=A0A0D1XKG6_EXOME|nr:uncharacterized protein PV10_08354 [Exophiala mesophila]KIV88696.1 hypothetical protein PV10_08354 [Exophiala mesophila]
MARVNTPKASNWNPRTVTAPIAALVMAGLLYTYSVTSIRAAKRNARLHREADGGQLDMRKESLRRHGALKPVEGTSGLELFTQARSDVKSESKYLTEKKAKPLGANQHEEVGHPRTENESKLEGMRDLGALEKWKQEQSKS